MSPKKIPEKLKKLIDNIEPISPYALEILNLAESEDTSLLDIARKVSIDPVISTHLFKACSSAAINKKIESPFQAVAVLGLKKVIEIILTTSIRNSVDKVISTYDFDIWEHNLIVAYSVQALIRKFQLPLGLAKGFTAGLLHDMGKFILIKSDPNSPIIQEQVNFECNMDIIEKEKKVYGASHVDIMEYLFSTWNLPEEITTAILNHHNDIEKQTGIARLLSISHSMIKTDRLSEEEIERLYEVTGLTKEDLIFLYNSVQREIQMVNFFFD